MSLLSDLKQAIKGKKTEHGERNAASSVLIQYGYTAQPEVEKRKQPDNSVVRIYTWYDTPAGDVCLITGPSIEGEIVQLNAPESYKAPQRVLGEYSTPRRNKKPKTVRRPATRAFDHHEGSIPYAKGYQSSNLPIDTPDAFSSSPHSLQPQSVRGNPIADEVKEVRALLTPIAKQYGQRISVRKGTGSMRGSVLIRGDHNATNPALRIAVIKALMSAGFEESVGGNDLAGLLSLSENYDHALINFAVYKAKKNPISKFEMEQIGLTDTPYYKELESVDQYDTQTKKAQGESAKEIRALLKPIVKKYGQQVSVKQARGIGDVRVLAPIVDPAMHNEVVSVLKKAGFEGFGLDKIFTQDSINLSVSKSSPLRSNPKKGPQKKTFTALMNTARSLLKFRESFP